MTLSPLLVVLLLWKVVQKDVLPLASRTKKKKKKECRKG